MPYIKDMGETPQTTSLQTIMTRKIEREMNAAIASGKEWRKANTEVTHNADGVACVYLHGHKIAEIGEGWIQLWSHGYETTTTKSRMNAILAENGIPGECVFQKAFNWFVQQEGGPIPFFDGMRLN